MVRNQAVSEKLRQGLAGFWGTEQYHVNPFYPKMPWTDGVQYFAENAASFWLLDILGTEVEPLQRRKQESFFNIVVVSKDGKATISVDDGNDVSMYAKEIDYTDLPEGEWQFFMEGSVLLLPSEH